MVKGAIEMDLKWQPGNVVLGGDGLPQRVDGLEEVLQNAAMAVSLPRGSFLYGPELGSGLENLDPREEHSRERACAFAGEALLEQPGVQVIQAEYEETTGRWSFTLVTPLGEGKIYGTGKERRYGTV